MLEEWPPPQRLSADPCSRPTRAVASSAWYRCSTSGRPSQSASGTQRLLTARTRLGVWSLLFRTTTYPNHSIPRHPYGYGRGEISVCSAPHFVPTLRVGWSLRDCSLLVSRTHASLWIERSRHWLFETSWQGTVSRHMQNQNLSVDCEVYF